MALHTLAVVVVLRYGVGLVPGNQSQHNIALPPWICPMQLAVNGAPYSLPSQPWYAAGLERVSSTLARAKCTKPGRCYPIYHLLLCTLMMTGAQLQGRGPTDHLSYPTFTFRR